MIADTVPDSFTEREADRDAKLRAFKRMARDGGGFCENLAQAWFRADATNAKILEQAFAHLIERYME